MEAVAAVGLASNILQLVQVTKSVAFIVKDIRKSTSGFSTETARFRSLAQLVRKDLNALQTGKGLNDEIRQCVDTLCGQLDQFDIDLKTFASASQGIGSRRQKSRLRYGLVKIDLTDRWLTLRR